MKKSIKVKFIGWYKEFDYRSFPLFCNDIISNNFDFVISDEPDFVFYFCFGNFIDYILSYQNAVKILIITEPMSPDFTFFDYVFSFEPYDFGGRNIFYPSFAYDSNILEKISITDAKKIVKQKHIFCDFIYRHETKGNIRKHYIDLLNSYKRVESCGEYLNNQADNKIVGYSNGDLSKFYYQTKSKFSLCIQSCCYPWFINEKICHAIMANEIPIFYGPTNVDKIFNKKRIICISDYDNDEDLLERIKEIDRDDDLFCSIISEEPFVEKDFQKQTLQNAHLSLKKILENGNVIIRETKFLSKKIASNIKDEHNLYLKIKNSKLLSAVIKIRNLFK